MCIVGGQQGCPVVPASLSGLQEAQLSRKPSSGRGVGPPIPGLTSAVPLPGGGHSPAVWLCTCS